MNNQQTYSSTRWAGILLTVAGAIFFSTKAIIVKIAYRDTGIDPVSLLAARMLFALPFYAGAAWITRTRKNAATLTRKQWWFLVLLGLCGYYLSSLFDFLGLQFISAGLERLILFLYPTLSVLINALFFGEKIQRAQRISLVLTYSGIALAYAGELAIGQNNPAFLQGSLLVLLGAICFATYISGSGRMIPQMGAAKFTAYAMMVSTAGVFVHFLVSGNYDAIRQPGSFAWYGLTLAIVATVIPSFLISYGMKKIGSNDVAIISSLGPVSTIAQAYFFLGEPIFPEQVGGTLLVIAGVLLLGWKRKKSGIQKLAG